MAHRRVIPSVVGGFGSDIGIRLRSVGDLRPDIGIRIRSAGDLGSDIGIRMWVGLVTCGVM